MIFEMECTARLPIFLIAPPVGAVSDDLTIVGARHRNYAQRVAQYCFMWLRRNFH